MFGNTEGNIASIQKSENSRLETISTRTRASKNVAAAAISTARKARAMAVSLKKEIARKAVNTMAAIVSIEAGKSRRRDFSHLRKLPVARLLPD